MINKNKQKKWEENKKKVKANQERWKRKRDKWKENKNMKRKLSKQWGTRNKTQISIEKLKI